MSAAQRLSQVFGWIFVVVGIAGFAVTGGSMEASTVAAPKLLGIFPVNALHNVVHLLFGLWGIVAARGASSARSYLFGAGTIYLVLAVCGYFVPDGFGLVPLGGSDIGLHAVLGIALVGCALVTSRRAATAAA
jgi:hypothetical protein